MKKIRLIMMVYIRVLEDGIKSFDHYLETERRGFLFSKWYDKHNKNRFCHIPKFFFQKQAFVPLYLVLFFILFISSLYYLNRSWFESQLAYFPAMWLLQVLNLFRELIFHFVKFKLATI